MSTKYCLGFCFNESKDSVVLMVKRRPAWQAGLLNGVGGHIEENESVAESMPREFFEETGVQTHERDWHLFCELQGQHFHVFCFWMNSDAAHNSAQTKTDEYVLAVSVEDLSEHDIISNLSWLIPLALDEGQHDRPQMTTVNY